MHDLEPKYLLLRLRKLLTLTKMSPARSLQANVNISETKWRSDILLVCNESRKNIPKDINQRVRIYYGSI